MTRLLATIRTDLAVQYRNGFYWVTLALIPLFVGMLTLVGRLPDLDFMLLLVLIASFNLIVTTFYFAAGLVLLERAEHTLRGLSVTPLRVWEYMAARLITLVLLAMAETAAIILLVHDGPVDPGLLLLGMGGLGVLYTLFGLGAVARHTAINDFLPPSIVWVTVFSLPLIPLFGGPGGPLWLAHPVTPGLDLILAAFGRGDGPIWTRMVLLALWGAAAYGWAQGRMAAVMRAGD